MSIIILKTKERKELAKKVLSRLKLEKGLDAKKYCGKISLREDPLLYQKKIRDEWS